MVVLLPVAEVGSAVDKAGIPRERVVCLREGGNISDKRRQQIVGSVHVGGTNARKSGCRNSRIAGAEADRVGRRDPRVVIRCGEDSLQLVAELDGMLALHLGRIVIEGVGVGEASLATEG